MFIVYTTLSKIISIIYKWNSNRNVSKVCVWLDILNIKLIKKTNPEMSQEKERPLWQKDEVRKNYITKYQDIIKL